MTIDTIQTEFVSMLPALSKRIRGYATKFADGQEAYTEMLATCWINFRQKALQGELLLPPHQLAYVAYVRLASGRTLTGYSVCDAMAPAAFKLGRCRKIFLSDLTRSKVNETLTDSAIKHITHSLTTREWQTPLVRAMIRIDWAEFSKTLSRKFRRLLHCLIVGFSKGDAAKRLRVSPGRISQMLKVLGDKVEEFFGPGIVPAV